MLPKVDESTITMSCALEYPPGRQLLQAHCFVTEIVGRDFSFWYAYFSSEGSVRGNSWLSRRPECRMSMVSSYGNTMFHVIYTEAIRNAREVSKPRSERRCVAFYLSFLQPQEYLTFAFVCFIFSRNKQCMDTRARNVLEKLDCRAFHF